MHLNHMLMITVGIHSNFGPKNDIDSFTNKYAFFG